MRAITGLFLFFVVGLSVLSLAGPASAEIVNVVFLHTGDTQGHLYSFTPFDESLSEIGATFKPVGGVAKRHIFVNFKRKHTKQAWILLDSGGVFGGSLLSTFYKGSVDIEMMNKLKYDAMCLGSPEFRFGQDVLKERMESANFPVLCANVKVADTGEYFTEPYAVLETDGLRIGIIGLIGADAADRINPRMTQGLVFEDPLTAAKRVVPEVEEKADIIVALTYQGVSEDIILAGEMPSIDIIIGARSETELELPMRMGDTLIVHSGKWGEKVGMLKVSFEGDSDSGFQIRHFDEILVPMDGKWTENTDILKILNGYSQNLDTRLGMVINELPEELGSAMIKASESALGNFAADVSREYAGADVAFITAASIRDGLPAGPISVHDFYTAFPCDHVLVTYELTGRELWWLLSEGASKIGQNGFPQVSGVTFGIFGGKAYEATVKGIDIVPDAKYTVVTTDYVAGGGDGYSIFQRLTPLVYTGETLRGAAENYARQHTVISPVVEGRVYFLSEPSAELPDEVLTEHYVPPYEEPKVEPTEDSGIATDGGVAELPDEGIMNIEDVDTGAPTDAGIPAGEEPVEQPPMVDETYIGIAELTEDDLHYAFAVLPRMRDGLEIYEFRLVVTNQGEVNELVNFPTHQRFDFFVKEDDRVVWNYGFWHYWVPQVDSVTIPAGGSLEFTAYWDGIENNGLPASRKIYRFEAQFLATVGVPVGFRSLLEWSEQMPADATGGDVDIAPEGIVEETESVEGSAGEGDEGAGESEDGGDEGAGESESEGEINPPPEGWF